MLALGVQHGVADVDAAGGDDAVEARRPRLPRPPGRCGAAAQRTRRRRDAQPGRFRAAARVSAARRPSACRRPTLCPWLVVDLLEVVEVDHHQPRDLAVALRAGDLQLEVVLEQPAVAKTRQRVVVGEVAQVLLQALALGDVLQLGDVVKRLRPSRSRTSDTERIADSVSPGGVEVALLDLKGGDLAGQQALALRARRCRRRRGARCRRSACPTSSSAV